MFTVTLAFGPAEFTIGHGGGHGYGISPRCVTHDAVSSITCAGMDLDSVAPDSFS